MKINKILKGMIIINFLKEFKENKKGQSKVEWVMLLSLFIIALLFILSPFFILNVIRDIPILYYSYLGIYIFTIAKFTFKLVKMLIVKDKTK